MSPGSEHLPDRIAAPDENQEAGGCSVNIESVGSAVARLPVDTFIKHVLPPLRESFTPPKVDKILTGLKVKHRGQKSAAYSARNQRWTAFDEVEKPTEYAAYQALVTISNQIIAEVERILKSKCPERLFDFVMESNADPVSMARNSTPKPGGYFVLREEYRQTKGRLEDKSKTTSKKDTKDKSHWMNVGPMGHYKSDDTEKAVKDDLDKFLWNVTHTMYGDARRRFAFGFTIEDTNMHFWYASRADILMSHNFDFMKQPDILLRVFLAFLYATETEAGWDPTMECVWDGSTPQYIITIHDARKEGHRYKTVETLFDEGARSLRGRGTRVWKVVPYDISPTSKTYTTGSQATELVLKDCWVDQGADKEGDVVDAILADAAKRALEWKKIVAQHGHNSEELAGFPDEIKFTDDDLEELKKSLLLPLIHSEVLGSASLASDKTLNRANLWLGEQVPYHRLWHRVVLRNARFEIQTRSLQEQPNGEHRNVYRYRGGSDEPVMYNQKVHYRVVFAEVCRALRDEPYLHRAYMYMAMTCQALMLLHKTGWVHRDISAGNILISSQGSVKLADFEYAKRIKSEDGTRPDICTGTREFMAVEVQKTSYLFLPLELFTLKDKVHGERDFRFAEDMEDGMEFRPNLDMASRPALGTKLTWLYNPIHDMESLMWLANYFTVGKNIEFHPTSATIPDLFFDEEAIIPETRYEREQRIIRQEVYALNLSYRADDREKTLKSFAGWDKLVHPALMKAGILLILNTVRVRLVARYVEAEKNISVSRQVLAEEDLYMGMSIDFIDACQQVERFSHLAVMTDLARAVAGLQEKTIIPVAQLPDSSGVQDSTFTSSSKTTKLARATRRRAAPTAPTRIQPKRNLTGRLLLKDVAESPSPKFNPRKSGSKKNTKTRGRAIRG